MNLNSIQNQFSKKNIFFYIILLIPIWIVSGPFLPDLLVVLSSLFFFKFFYQNKIFFFNIKFVKLFLIFYLILIFSTIFSDNILYSFKTTLPYIRFLFFTLIIFSFCIFNKDFIKIFSKVFVFIYLLIVFDAYFQFIFGYNLIGLVSPIDNRLSGFFGDELILGSYLSRLFPLFFFCLYFLKIKFSFIFFFTMITGISTLFIGDRTGLLFMFLINIYFFLLNKEFRKFSLIFFIFYLLIGIVLINFNSNINSRYTQTLGELGINKKYVPGYNFDLKNYNNKLFKKFNFFSPMHENYLMTSLNIFKDSPILGHGPRSYRLKCKLPEYSFDQLSCSTHPHNVYAQLLSETGLIGSIFIFIIFLYFLFLPIRHFIFSFNVVKYKKYLLSNFEICLLPSFLITLFPFAPSGNFFNNWLSIVYFLPVGFYLSLKYLKSINYEK